MAGLVYEVRSQIGGPFTLGSASRGGTCRSESRETALTLRLRAVGRAKGSNMHHMRTWVERTCGPDEWVTLIESMATRDEAELRGLVAVGWYDLALQHRLLRQIDKHFGVGDGALAGVIGAFEAEQDLTVIHRMFLRLASPAFVLEKAMDYWSRFYDTGHWEVRRTGPKSAVGTLTGCEPLDPLLEPYLCAYICRMWELVGAHSPQVRSENQSGRLFFHGSWS